MSKVIFYTRPNGRQPVMSFYDEQSRAVQSDIDIKMKRLEMYGLDTLIKSPLVRFLGPKALYELRNRGLGWRIAFYHYETGDYVMLCGWKKQKDLQLADVEQARALAREYQDYKG